MTQYYSRIDTTLNGDVYNIPFSYMKESEISVYINDEPITAWEFLNESQIKINEMSSEIPADAIVSIRRTTDITKKVVDYTNQSMLKKENLNLSQNQLLNAVQEIYDNNVQFEIDTENNILQNRTEIDAQIEANNQELLDIQSSFEAEVTQTIADNKQEVLDIQADFKREVNTTIETVTEAAEKINNLEQAVEEAKTAAQTATSKADETQEVLVNAVTEIDSKLTTAESSMDSRLSSATATMNEKLSAANTAVENAMQQANLATQKAQEILDVNPANTNLSNLTEAGLKVIKDNSGSSLEVGDIGMALYVDEIKGLRRYLNGQVVDINTNTQAFLDRLKQIQATNPDYFTTEENWQTEALLNIDGCVYKFVLNYSGETVVSVRLPKYPDYVEINAGGTLPVVGNGMTLGLTDGTSNGALVQWGATTAMTNAKGALYGKNVGTTTNAQDAFATYAGIGVVSDPSKSGIQTTLKQTKLKMRYFIQIATGSETEANIVNTLENVNGFTLLESKYSDKPLYHESWLLSNGQYNAKAVYPTVYEGLQVEYNTEIEVGTTVTLPSGVSYTKRGLSVKLSTEEYTDYDFRLNTADETFRLPLLNGSENLPSQKFDNLTLTSSDSIYIAPANGRYYLKMSANTGQFINMHRIDANGDDIAVLHDVSVNNLDVFTEMEVSKGDKVRITHNTTGNVLAFKFIYAQGNGSLYFYVGDIDQNHGIVNMGRIGEQLANKQDKCVHIIDTYINGTSGYNIWSNGYCEQWGIWASPAGTTALTFMKTFADTNYQVFCSIQATGMTGAYYSPGVENNVAKTTTGCTIGWRNSGTVYWRACGYLAEGEY